jgi:hypothetical protein
MAWFGVGSGSRRAKPQRAQRFVQADRVVMEVFADLHEARHLRSKFPAMSRGALQEFERLESLDRLFDQVAAATQRRLIGFALPRSDTRCEV